MSTKVSPKKKHERGVTAEKDDFSEWFTQIMLKADLADYSSVSGCIIFKPTSYAIWENLKGHVDARFKKAGIQNVYFPLFIPEKTLMKEKKHLEGFSPEVAWVTHAGSTQLSEKLAVRPTSETIMYESFSKWIRSWRDLPLRYNQWNNVVRWEFKHPVPFLRTREFLWNEGHTVFATKAEAEAEGKVIIDIYNEVCEKYLALPSLIGKKTKNETFPGAEYTISMEFFMPNGRCVQGPDFHHDGQIFAKVYDIKFLNKEGKQEYAYQNTFAITTRMLGVMFAMHSDSKGLILPPKIAPHQVVFVPILFDDSKDRVIKRAKELASMLQKHAPLVDDRQEYNPGFKFNEWELKGVPLRIEIGPKDIAKDTVIIVRRDTNEKIEVKCKELVEKIPQLLEQIQEGLLAKAHKVLREGMVHAKTHAEVLHAIEHKKIALAPLSDSAEVEDDLKAQTGGAKVLNIPFNQPANIHEHKCIISGKPASYMAYVGKSY